MNIKSQKAALERTYFDKCDIYVTNEIKQGAVSRRAIKLQYEKIPCALSLVSVKPSSQTASVNLIDYDAKLFTAPEYDIPAGSSVVVFSQGAELNFVSSGESPAYPTHREIMLKRKARA